MRMRSGGQARQDRQSGKHRAVCALFLAAAVLAALAGCSRETSVPVQTSVGSAAERPTPKEAAQAEIIIETETQPEETEAPDDSHGGTSYYPLGEREEQGGMIRSYLTGQMVDAAKGKRRPVAVMMSNDKAARPQYGINRAGVVYEAPVEAGMNRYMAILEDYDDLERIGSVRSCRTYYTYFAREYDALYAHFGQSTFAKPYLENVDNINGIAGIGSAAFYRSSDKKAPHNAYTSGGRLQKAIADLGYRQEYDSAYQGHFLFARDGVEVSLDGRPGVREALTVKPGYTLNEACFVYSEEDGLYHRYQYGAVHEGSEGPITAKNLVFQYCAVGNYATTDYLNIDVHAADYGYFMTGGQAVPLTWEKDGEFGVTHYYDQNHEEIVFAQGQTWICIIPTRDFHRTEIGGQTGAE